MRDEGLDASQLKRAAKRNARLIIIILSISCHIWRKKKQAKHRSVSLRNGVDSFCPRDSRTRFWSRFCKMSNQLAFSLVVMAQIMTFCSSSISRASLNRDVMLTCRRGGRKFRNEMNIFLVAISTLAFAPALIDKSFGRLAHVSVGAPPDAHLHLDS